MQPKSEWVKQVVKPFLKKSTEEEDTTYFLRDEIRPIVRDEDVFFSCADGIVLYNKIVKSPKEVVEIKGVDYSVEDIMGMKDVYEGPALVCGVFMTYADIHINRVPYTAQLEYKTVDPIQSFNLSMDDQENRIFNGERPLMGRGAQKDKGMVDNLYLKKNSRMFNRFYIPQLNYNYYIIQIADYDVDVIMHFNTQQKKMLFQGDRFSFIRWGSQCDMILPLRKDLDIRPLIKPDFHVKAGLDKIINFTKK
jgi:phosphatidylserine decarboxylase